MPQFTVVLRARTTLRFVRNESVVLRGIPSSAGPVTVTYRTRRVATPGFTNPVPRGIWVEAVGEAKSLDQALDAFSGAAQGFMPIFTFVTNGPTEDLVAELAFDSSPGTRDRDFFQLFAPDQPLRPSNPRRVDPALVVECLRVVARHPRHERLSRALAHYHHCLQNWWPGRDILALNHLWMALECLTPVARERLLSATGATATTLAQRWGIDERVLDAEVRRRDLLGGDDELYTEAKKASDGFEHGFLGIPKLRTTSATYKPKLALAVRRAIAREVGLSPALEAQIFTQETARPAELTVVQFLRTAIGGPHDNLALPDQIYPLFSWTISTTEGPLDTDGEPTLKMTNKIDSRCAPGTTFGDGKVEMWAF